MVKLKAYVVLLELLSQPKINSANTDIAPGQERLGEPRD